MQTHTTSRRRNRVYKSLHKPLTYLGVERTVFFFVLRWRSWHIQSLQQPPCRCRGIYWWVRIRKLGHQH